MNDGDNGLRTKKDVTHSQSASSFRSATGFRFDSYPMRKWTSATRTLMEFGMMIRRRSTYGSDFLSLAVDIFLHMNLATPGWTGNIDIWMMERPVPDGE